MRQYRWQLIGGNIKAGNRPVSVKKGRGVWLKLLLIFVFSWFVSRAFFLQIVLGKVNAKKAEENRIEVRAVAANRGVIEDRRGVILARNSLNAEGEVVREYPLGEALSHVVGYVGKGEVVFEGKTGIEKWFDFDLKGEMGEEVVEENARGRELGSRRQKEPVNGKNLKLALDAQLQEKIAAVLAERGKERPTSGAVIVSKAEDGQVLALLSWPTFDANWFTNNGPVEKLLGDNKHKPLFNRAIAGLYPPGSVFKLVTATAGLEEEKIDGETLVEDTGEIKVGEFRFGTWNFDQSGKKEGLVDVVKALTRSNDIYFYKVGEWLGIDLLSAWSQKMGLGQVSGIEIAGEVAGTVPDRAKKERLTGERWFLGNTYHTAIGQGDTLVTPLQVNMFTAAAVTGRLCKPQVSSQFSDVRCQDLEISKQTREIVLEGMIGACQSGGTAFPFFDAPYQAACKTGTAQHGGEKTEPHAWITVVLPISTNDQLDSYEKGIVITVLLEEAGEGSYEAGPVARKIADFVVDKMRTGDL